MRKYVPDCVFNKFEIVPETEYIKPKGVYDIGDEYALIFEYFKVLNPLRSAIKYAGDHGKIPNFHELIKLIAEHDFPESTYTSLSEEIIGIDKAGLYGEPGEPVLAVIHNAGLLTPDMIIRGTIEESLYNIVTIKEPIFTNLLDGKLPNGKQIHISTPQEVGIPKDGEPFGVVIPYKEAQNSETYSSKNELSQNPLVSARLAGCDKDTFDKFYDKQKIRKLYNGHPYQKMDISYPQGRLLEVNICTYNGFDCYIDKFTDFKFIVTIPKEYGIKGINIDDAKII